jgi:hypothetical protein
MRRARVQVGARLITPVRGVGTSTEYRWLLPEYKFVCKLSFHPLRLGHGTGTFEGLHLSAGLGPGSQKACVCLAPGEPWVVQLPIHPRVRLADNGGKFFVLCFQPVTFPCALCAQVTRASARETMATADSRSARDRHWNAGPSEPLAPFRHTPPTRVTDGRDPVRDELQRACTSARAKTREP